MTVRNHFSKGPAAGRLCLTVLSLCLVCLCATASAYGSVAWAIRSVAGPTQFSPNDSVRCEKRPSFCDRYQLLPMNIGDSDSTGTIVVKDRLPSGLVTVEKPEAEGWNCLGGGGETEVMCEYEGSVPGGHVVHPLVIYVTWPSESQNGQFLTNKASITGGGTGVVTTTSEQTLVSSKPPSFGLDEFTVEAGTANAGNSIQAGTRPWQITTNLEIPTVELPVQVPRSQGEILAPVQAWKSASVELPVGVIGDTQTRAECTGYDLEKEGCPTASIVGSVETGTTITADELAILNRMNSTLRSTTSYPRRGIRPSSASISQAMPSTCTRAWCVPREAIDCGVSVPGLPGGGVGAFGAVTTFYGNPAAVEKETPKGAFLTNPTRCTGEEKARAEVESWGRSRRPGRSRNDVLPAAHWLRPSEPAVPPYGRHGTQRTRRRPTAGRHRPGR